MLSHGHQVGQRLGWMVDVALEVDHRGLGVPGHLAHVCVALVRDEVVTDGDPVPVPGQDDPHVLRTLPVGHLRLLGVEVVRVSAQLGHPRFERVAGPGGLVQEQHEQGLVGEEPMGLASPELLLELGGDG